MTQSFEIALLAPVPFEHLDSGWKTNLAKIAFGSRAFETFYELNNLRKNLTVATYIYASHTDKPIGPQVSWQAQFIGSVNSEDLPSNYEQLYRPPTAQKYHDDTRDFWPLFWEVTNLQPLLKPFPIHLLTGKGRKRPYQKNFVPEGPVLIEYPYLDK